MSRITVAPAACISLALVFVCTHPRTVPAGETGRNELRISLVWDDLKHLGTAPVRMNLLDWAAWAGIIGTTAVLYSQDEEIRTEFNDLPENAFYEYTAHLGSWAGDGFIVFPLFVAGGLGGYLLKRPRLVRISIAALESMTVAGLFVQIPKMTLGRARPSRNLGPYYFKGFELTDTGFHSLPSGHAAVSGAIAGVLIGEFDSIVVDVLAILLAGSTAFERAYADKHWASDAFLGSAIGVAVGRSIARRRKERSREEAGTVLIPLAGPRYSGIQVVTLF